MKKLVPLATLLALIVIVVGAYVRLSDAGLSCPDWPGCYGQAIVAAGAGADIDTRKAWIEMGHRYLAGTLGLLIFAIAVIAWLRRDRNQPALLPVLLLILVVFQALLGMWTVTLLLKPLVVTLHLLGGMATLALLVWLMMRTNPPRHEINMGASRIDTWSTISLILLFAQIALGGWVSANYAALACGDFPLCLGQWAPPMDFAQGFQVTRDLGQSTAGTPLPAEALTAIHWAHRLGALIVAFYFAALAAALFSAPGLRVYSVLMITVLAIQIALGAGNVLLSLPLAMAVAHNAVAALLLMVLVMLNFRTHSGGGRESRWHRA